MIQSIIICPDRELSTELTAALNETGQVRVARDLDHYPTVVELARILRAHAPEIAFLSFDSVQHAQACVKVLDSESPSLQIVAVHPSLDPAVLRESMRIGVREFLPAPYTRDAVIESLKHVKHLLEQKPVIPVTTNQIFSFLPSKAGSGASTIALNVSTAFARQPNTRALLCDLDLSCGIVRFLLKLKNDNSFIDAVEHHSHMDEALWPQLITVREQLDVLHAGRLNPQFRVEPEQVRPLLGFMRRNYSALFFDMSGNLERYSIEIMLESKRIFLVCTPEIPSLHLAREKLQFLKSLDLHHRVSVLLNRVSKKSLFGAAEVEKLLEFPVAKVFLNDYSRVNEAMTAGTVVSPASELGKLFAVFAQELTRGRPGVNGHEKRSFLEHFPVAPAAYAR